MFSRKKTDAGQTAILAAGFFAILAVFLAVALFLGMAYTQRRSLQNAADAAALAGAQELDGTPAREDAAIAAAEAYIDKNISGLTFSQVTVGDGYTSVTVRIEKTMDTAGLSTFGLTDPDIGADAKAMIRSATLPGPGVVPLAINEATWDRCQEEDCNPVVLKEWTEDDEDPPSDHHLIDLGGSGAADVCDFLIGGSTNPVTDPVDNEPGNVSSIHNCLIVRMDAARDFGCLTRDEVLDENGALREECHPLGAAGRGAYAPMPNAQPTSIIVIPVVSDFCKGKCDLDIIQEGEVRLFALLRIFEETVYGPNPTCAPPKKGGKGQCLITGEFISTYPALLLPGGATDVTVFDPDALLKAVQLVE